MKKQNKTGHFSSMSLTPSTTLTLMEIFAVLQSTKIDKQQSLLNVERIGSKSLKFVKKILVNTGLRWNLNYFVRIPSNM